MPKSALQRCLLMGVLALGIGCSESTEDTSEMGEGVTGDVDAGNDENADTEPDEPADAGTDANGDTDEATDESTDPGPVDADAAVPDPEDPDPSDPVDPEPTDSDPVDPDPAGHEIEISGRWHSNFGGVEVIGSELWTSYGDVAVVEFDNDENYAITQNSPDTAWNPNAFSKIVWTEIEDGRFYYCTVDYGFATVDDARNSTMTADATNPEAGGCGSFPWTRLDEVIEIEGRWHSNFGGVEAIDSDVWASYGEVAVIEYDNEGNYAITQNPADATYNPSLFSKIVWTEVEDGSFFYCTVDYGLATAEDARNTTMTADDTSPETGGCGGFSWTRLSPVIEIEGRWHSNFGGTETIDSDVWASYGDVDVIEYDNEGNYAITQNAPDAAYNPSLFSKVVWTEIEEGGFYYCTVVYGLATAAAARNTTMTADNTSPAMGGCGGFPWTRLDPVIEIEGAWQSNFGGTETIDSDVWSSYGDVNVIEYDNDSNYAITQNPPDATYNPSLFSKIVWTEIDEGSFYYCTVDYGRATAEDARNTSMTADATDPENGGCGGFSWTRLDAE